MDAGVSAQVDLPPVFDAAAFLLPEEESLFGALENTQAQTDGALFGQGGAPLWRSGRPGQPIPAAGVMAREPGQATRASTAAFPCTASASKAEPMLFWPDAGLWADNVELMLAASQVVLV